MRGFGFTLVLLPACVGVMGCTATSPSDGTGGNGTGDNGGGLTALDPINFVADLPRGDDPATFSIGGGAVRFAGGTAGTLGILPLYALGDAFAWDLAAGGTSTVTFTNLDVRMVRLYFAHIGATGVTLLAIGTDGSVLGSVQSVAAAIQGDPAATVSIDAGDATIAGLEIEVPVGAVVAIDALALTIAP